MPTHAEKRLVRHTPEQIFDLVADVERYPEFLPWCIAVRINERHGDVIDAELVIGFKMFRERFTSRVQLDPYRQIDVAYTKGPLKYLSNHWKFEATEDGCLIDFYVDFEFRSKILEKMIGVVFNEAVRRMVGAFEQRANDIYG